jgi:long-subunit fatty acid transport protein
MVGRFFRFFGLVCIALLVQTCCLSGFLGKNAFSAGMPDTYGFGMRAMSLGGAFTAVADDYSATFYNPAGLVQLEASQLSFEFLYTHPSFDVESLATGEDLVTYDANGDIRTDPSSGLNQRFFTFGAVADMNKMDIIDLSHHIQIGFAASLSEGIHLSQRMKGYPPDQPHFIRYGDSIDRMNLALGTGIELIDGKVSVGVGMQAMMDIKRGRTYTNEVSGDTIAQGGADVEMRYDPIAGLLFTPGSGNMRIGFSWRDEQLAEADVLNIKEDDGTTTYVELENFFVPEEYSLGICFDRNTFFISIEANKQKWSGYNDFRAKDQYYYGESTDFKDTLNKRVGIGWRMNEATTVMAGFCSQESPVPDQSGRRSNYIDMDKYIYSLGIFKIVKPERFHKPLQVVGTLQYQKCDDYTVDKTGVTGVTWVNQESYKVKGDIYSGGISASFIW